VIQKGKRHIEFGTIIIKRVEDERFEPSRLSSTRALGSYVNLPTVVYLSI